MMPQVMRLTKEATGKVEQVLSDVVELREDDPARTDAESEARQIIDDWAQSVMALGAEVKGLWLVDFDAGDGYYCWKHPEETLAYFHGYDEGFTGRRPITPPLLH